MSFVANGLLAVSAPVLVKTPLFEPNGLLGTLQPSQDAIDVDPSDSESDDILSALSAGTTLVGDISTQDSLLQQSQDDDLPDTSIFLEFCKSNDRPAPRPRALPPSPSLQTLYPRPIICATAFDGRTLHLKRRARINNVPRKDNSGQRIGNVLDVPIHRLMDELSAKTAAQLDRVNFQQSVPTHQTNENATLWVDRYRPSCFADLLGNDRVAREIMAWVKQWDWCVFGKKKSRKRPRADDENHPEEDDYHRPSQKILLLSGPPGLGKTTLAHVVACQAGYEVMEINASDARSGQVVDERIRPALESGTAVGGTKPVLLVIDEIDGATGGGENSTGFVQKLVELTHDGPKRKQRGSYKRDIQRKRPLLRPIICICNDQNAASLARLRPHAYLLRFTRPSDVLTVRRLQQICGFEGLNADARALTTLVGVAKGDLRGCLNTLQFIKAKNEHVTENVVRAATIGMKEADTTVSVSLNSLFVPLTRKRLKELGLNDIDESKYVSRLCREVEGSGKVSTVATGCFAHYATLRHHDVDFSRYEKAGEWLGAFDIFNSAMYSDGEFDLSAYLAYMLVSFFPLFQDRAAQAVERSHADWEQLQRLRSNEEIYESLSRSAHACFGGNFRHLASKPTFQLEFIPYLNRIISPPLRPVNSQIIRPDERAVLSRLVDIMASLELRFVQERTDDGQLVYRLDPPIDVFVTYDGKRASDIPVSRYAVRHLVAAEIESLLSRRADAKETRRAVKSVKSAQTATQNEETIDEIRSTKQKVDVYKPPTDFFGRPIIGPPGGQKKAVAGKNTEKKFRIFYKFRAGNSAAVRKAVKVGAFL